MNKFYTDPQEYFRKMDSPVIRSSIESLRQKALADALGDADLATQLFLENLVQGDNKLKNLLNGGLKEPEK